MSQKTKRRNKTVGELSFIKAIHQFIFHFVHIYVSLRRQERIYKSISWAGVVGSSMCKVHALQIKETELGSQASVSKPNAAAAVCVCSCAAQRWKEVGPGASLVSQSSQSGELQFSETL